MACQNFGSDPATGPILDPETIDSIAQRVVEFLREEEPSGRRLLGPNEVAAMLGRSRDWVYAHRHELGVIELGSGERPRLYFDVQAIADRLSSRSARESSKTPSRAAAPKRRQARKKPSDQGERIPLLPIKEVT